MSELLDAYKAKANAELASQVDAVAVQLIDKDIAQRTAEIEALNAAKAEISPTEPQVG